MAVLLDRLLDKYEAARLLGVAAGTVMNRQWRQRVGLEAIRVGGVLRFKPDDIAALQERGRETHDQARSRQGMQRDAYEGTHHAASIRRHPARH
jgi:hypothetical protein